jgi:Domain of unknown function (DUF4262)
MSDSSGSHWLAEDAMRACREAIARYGWHCTGVFADTVTDDPPFAYTTGLAESFTAPDSHPELAIVGLPPRQGHGVLRAAVHLIKTGECLADGDERDGILEGFPVRFRSVNLSSCTLTFSLSDNYYLRPVPRLQLLWPDPAGRFPGELGCDAPIARIQHID